MNDNWNWGKYLMKERLLYHENPCWGIVCNMKIGYAILIMRIAYPIFMNICKAPMVMRKKKTVNTYYQSYAHQIFLSFHTKTIV